MHGWAHNIRGIEWAEAGLRALSESGLRARFSFGYETGHPNDRLMAVDTLTRIAGAWPAYGAGGRVHLGMAWRGAGGSNPAMRVAPAPAAAHGTPASASPFTELRTGYGQPVTAAHPGNVEMVLAGGRVLKRSGQLTGCDVAEVTRSARDALAGVLTRA